MYICNVYATENSAENLFKFLTFTCIKNYVRTVQSQLWEQKFKARRSLFMQYVTHIANKYKQSMPLLYRQNQRIL
jgi:hypothetical protein